MAGGLDMARADRARRQQQTEARREAERNARKMAPGPQNKMLGGPLANKANPAKIAPSQRPELAGVVFASAPARVQAEGAGLSSSDFPSEARSRGVTTRDVRQAIEQRGR